MKIGISIRLFTPGSGGLQHHAARLVEQLRGRGHEVRVATRALTHHPTFQGYFFFSESEQTQANAGPNLAVLRHPSWALPLLWLSYKLCRRPAWMNAGIRIYNAIHARPMTRALRGCDVVHHIGQGSEMIGFAAWAAARRLGIPFVVQPTAHPGQWGDAPIDLELYRRADRLLVHTEYERDALRALGLDAAYDIVSNGIEDRVDGSAERFRKRHNLTGPVILFLGRKSADKGYPLLLQAFAQVRKSHPTANLVALGPAGDTPAVDVPGLRDLGFAHDDEKHDALAACDILCVPSEGESFGLVFMEAARYGKPSVARNLPVLRELLGRHGAAFLVGPENAASNQVEVSEQELACALNRLLEHPAEAQMIGAKARRASEGCLWPEVIARFEHAYQAALGALERSTYDQTKHS